MKLPTDPLSPARGILLAFALGAAFWAGLVILYLWSKTA